MDNNRDALTSAAGYYAKPSATGNVWFIFGPAGNQVGACATRDDALRLIRLAGGSDANMRARAPQESAPHAGGTGHEGKRLDAPPMFGWYVGPHEQAAQSLLARFLMYLGVRGR